jgi:hypothetical protein
MSEEEDVQLRLLLKVGVLCTARPQDPGQKLKMEPQNLSRSAYAYLFDERLLIPKVLLCCWSSGLAVILLALMGASTRSPELETYRRENVVAVSTSVSDPLRRTFMFSCLFFSFLLGEIL